MISNFTDELEKDLFNWEFSHLLLRKKKGEYKHMLQLVG